MKKLVLSIAAFLIVIGISTAQDNNTASHQVSIVVPSVALLDIEDQTDNNITLTITNSAEAGEPLTFTATNSSLWLNYTSIVASGTRKIDANFDGNLPGGITLKVAASTPATGKGLLGTSQGPVSLTTNNQSVIGGIGSCYTGQGTNNGSQLTYSMVMDESKYGELMSGTHEVSITYTLIAE